MMTTAVCFARSVISRQPNMRQQVRICSARTGLIRVRLSYLSYTLAPPTFGAGTTRDSDLRMEDERFDALAKGIGLHPSRRTMIKELLGITGGGTGLTLSNSEVDAIESSYLCIPDRHGSYQLKLVPAVLVGRYRKSYHAIHPDDQNRCPPCQSGLTGREGFRIPNRDD
jgi:hypothetical protein